MSRGAGRGGDQQCKQRLVAVGILDRTPSYVSSVYFYYDPDIQSMGTYGALREIEYTRSLGVEYYTLGYYMEGCQKLEYKARFKPNEVLETEWAEGRTHWVPWKS